MKSPICRITPDNQDPFDLELIKEEEGWELRDPEGKLPLDAFDMINDAMIRDDESGRVYSPDEANWYAWEVIDEHATVLE